MNKLQRPKPLTLRGFFAPSSAGDTYGDTLILFSQEDAMPRKTTAKATGVWEKEQGSGVWWIRYRAEGKLKREKVGRKSDAIALYQQRKSELRAGVKLPSNLRAKGSTFLEIATEAENWYISHGKRDIRTVKIRMKRLIKEFGSQSADQISPARIDLWISKQDWSPATCNRYKALLSKTFKLALAAGKVAINPARLGGATHRECRTHSLPVTR
jgi:hypothetical protein